MHRSKNPSFSSTLLDDIYNSIDPKTHKSQSFVGSVNTTKKQSITVTRSVPDRKIHRFFGSASSSSDSSSSIFSSSDIELTHCKKITSSRPLCFGPSKTKVTKPRKTENKALFHQNRAISDYDYASDVPKTTRYDENLEKTTIRRSSGNLKKPKTPASPAGRIVNFINSLFSNNSKQSSMAVKSYPRKKTKSYEDSCFVTKPNDYYHPSSTTTCSSASSFSRSCLNKTSEKSSDRIKRSVRFSPVNVIFPESRSFVDKSSSLYAEEEEEDCFRNGDMRKSVKKNVEDGGGRRSVEEIAREFLRDYHKNHHDNSLMKKTNNDFEDYEDEDEDDDASDCSSDLFELDLVGNHHNLYGDELPVYETTFAGLIL